MWYLGEGQTETILQERKKKEGNNLSEGKKQSFIQLTNCASLSLSFPRLPPFLRCLGLILSHSHTLTLPLARVDQPFFSFLSFFFFFFLCCIQHHPSLFPFLILLPSCQHYSTLSFFFFLFIIILTSLYP